MMGAAWIVLMTVVTTTMMLIAIRDVVHEGETEGTDPLDDRHHVVPTVAVDEVGLLVVTVLVGIPVVVSCLRRGGQSEKQEKDGHMNSVV